MKNTGRKTGADPPAMLYDRSGHGTFWNGTEVKGRQGHQLWNGDVISFFAPKTETTESGEPAGSANLEDTTLMFCCDEKMAISMFQKKYIVYMKALGVGASSEVRKCRERRTGECFAVKIVKLTKFTSQKFIKSVENEVPVLQKLNHPNIVRYVDFVRESDALYIVLELFVMIQCA